MDRLLQFFNYSHLPADMQETSKRFHDLAVSMYEHLPSNPESTVAMRKLLEAKDAAVRSTIYVDPKKEGLNDAQT
jgi:ferritin-like protein